jgi:hypothetical protein
MHNAIAQWPAVVARGSLQGSVDTYKLAFKQVCMGMYDGVAMPSQIQEREMRRELRIGQLARSSCICAARVFQA